MIKIITGYGVLLLTIYLITVQLDFNNLVWKKCVVKHGKKKLTILAFIIYISLDIYLKIVLNESISYTILYNMILGLFYHIGRHQIRSNYKP